MTNELTKQQKCLLLTNGIEIWDDTDKLDALSQDLDKIDKGFIKIAGQILNTKMIAGIFEPQVMSDMRRTKQGQWKCKYGTWHNGKVETYCECGRAH